METNKAIIDASSQSKNEVDQENPVGKPEFVANSVLEVEVEKFKECSKSWWPEAGRPLRILYTMNQLRVPYVVEKAKESGKIRAEFAETETPLKGLKVLDVGCGGGFYAEALAKLGADVVGIDVTKEMIEIAKVHQALDKTLTNLQYKHVSIEEFALDNAEAFDMLVCSDVLEHVNDPRSFVGECAKCLKFGGSMIMQTISKTFLGKFFMIYLMENILGVIPKGSHDPNMFITSEDLIDMMAAGGCKTTEVRGMGVNPFTRNWSWTASTQVHYAAHALKTRN